VPITKLYRNSGGPNPIFTDVGAGLTAVQSSAVVWGDYDGDGNLDLLITGFGATGPVTKLYHNSGGANPTFTDVGAVLTDVQVSSVAFGDYDNDGDLDLLVTGADASFNSVTKLYRNNGGPNPTFTDVGAALDAVQEGAVAFGDYDNDGDLDILITGFTGTTNIAKLYRNSGGANPTFTDVGAGLTGVQTSSVAFGDYDNDGDLDILLTGFTGSARITKLYRNSGGANPTFTDVGAGLTGVNASSVAFGDYDNDGNLDILLTGFTGTSRITKLYRSSGGANPTFTDVGAGIVNVQSSSVAWGDYDNDGDLDILITGYDPGNIPTSKIYRNDGATPNTPPSTPSGLTAFKGLSYTTFSWIAATDAQTPSAALTYNLRVGTTPGGNEILSSMAAGNGYRRVVQLGNAQEKTSWSLAIPAGPYYWSVQAIDGAFQGSSFASSTIGVDETADVPARFELDSPSPNPFARDASLSYGLPRDARVEIAVFDLLGRRVRRLESGSRLAGRHRVVWDGRNESGAQLGNGVYMVRMTAAGNTWTRKLVLAR
jgi:predicted nucleotidyltransferase